MKVAVNAHDADFWTTVLSFKAHNVPFVVDLEGDTYEVEYFPGTRLHLIAAKANPAGVRQRVALTVPQ